MSTLTLKHFSLARPRLADGLSMLALSLLLAVSAHLQVPFWPVPMTLQTLAVLAIAGLAGTRVAVGAMLAYVAEGAIGLPVFAAGGGVAYLVGPTAGYLAGMLAATVVVAELVRRSAGRFTWVAGAMLLGTVLVYTAGAAWLSGFTGLDRAIELGVLPFLGGDAAKTALATALVLALRPARRA